MSEFLEDLGAEASVGDAFYALYGQVDAVVEKFEVMRRAYVDGAHYNYLPGTQLDFEWGSSVDMDTSGAIGRGQFDSTGLATRIRGDRYGLVRRGWFAPERGASSIPTTANGYRGQEISADYAIRQDKTSGLVEVSLGKFGLYRAVESIGDEPVGDDKFALEDKLKRLKGEERQRLVVVAAGIMNNIAAAELIGEGQDPQEVITLMGKPVRALRY